MRYAIRLIAIVCLGLSVLHAGPANAEKRLALAVGIDVYDHLPAHEQLQKAANDARAMGAALRDLGFETAVEENVAKLAFTRAWQRFLNRLQPGDTAALFFAGHGVEIGGLNYLLPRDVPKVVPGEDQVLAEASIRFNGLMDNLREKKVRIALFIVDACRDNPFRDGGGRSVGGTRGLARIEAAKGSFVMYSAGAGEQALDRLPGADTNPNSLFTRTLLPILKTPGLSVQDIATGVREKVVEAARGAGREQSPAYYDQLVGRFVLKAGIAADAKPPVVVQPPLSEAAETARICREVEGMSNLTTLAVLERQHKGRPAGECVTARIDELKRQQLTMLKAEEDRRRAEDERRRAEEDKKRVEAALTPGRVFRDCAECPEMVVVPAGSFTMGSPSSEPRRSADEGPQRRVTIARSVAFGKFEVTRGEFATFARESGRTVGDNCYTFESGQWAYRTGRSLRNPGFAQDDRHPAVCVSWDDATAFVAWLSRKTGKIYRLPTEAEWEYAARAGATTSYYFGNDERDLCRYGNAADQTARQKYKDWTGTVSCRDGHVYTAPVGSFQANAFGLHDMHGNAWEVVQDCWNESYSGAPSDGSAWTSGDCSRRVIRGGSAVTNPEDVRSARRWFAETGRHINSNGFRVVRTLTP